LNLPRGRPTDTGLEVRLFDACIETLTEVGYRQMSIDAIAKKASTSRPTIYRKFGSLNNLVIAAMTHFYQDEAATPGRTDDIYQDILNYLSGTVTLLTETKFGIAFRVIIPDMQRNEQFSRFAKELGSNRRKTLKKLLLEAKASGIVNNSADVEALIDGLIGAIYFRFLLSRGKLDRRYLKKLFDGLRQASPT